MGDECGWSGWQPTTRTPWAIDWWETVYSSRGFPSSVQSRPSDLDGRMASLDLPQSNLSSLTLIWNCSPSGHKIRHTIEMYSKRARNVVGMIFVKGGDFHFKYSSSICHFRPRFQNTDLSLSIASNGYPGDARWMVHQLLGNPVANQVDATMKSWLTGPNLWLNPPTVKESSVNAKPRTFIARLHSMWINPWKTT